MTSTHSITSTWTIRQAVATDVDALFSVRLSVNDNQMTLEELAQAGVTSESLPAMLIGRGRGWVVENAEEVVAFSMADADEATVFALFVRPTYESSGMGKALMLVAEQWLADEGCESVWLLTDADRAVRANGFYRHLGWKDAGIQDDGQVKFTKQLR